MTAIWTFKTANFTVRVTAEPENETLDLSWDETGEVREGLESGRFVAFCAKAVVEYRGAELAAGYLGACIYESESDFRDHVGLAMRSRADGRNYGSYFADMVKTVISEAREAMAEVPRLRTVSKGGR